MHSLVYCLIVAAVLGSGLMAGAFFAFSVAVMPAFRRLPAEVGMPAMKRINEVILNPLFLGVFVGTAAVSLVLALLSILLWKFPGGAFLLAGCLFHLIGSFGITAACNVPLNNKLAVAESIDFWDIYQLRWTMWNHVRTIANALAVIAFVLAAGEVGR